MQLIMKNVIKVLAAFALIFSANFTYAQDNNQDAHDIVINVPEVALLDLETNGNRTIKLQPEAPTEAGERLDFSKASNKDLWLNYSSIVSKENEPTRKVTVAITAGQVPNGLRVDLQASPALEGSGNLGKPADVLTLSENPQDLIVDIGSAFTGNGVSHGHNLAYKLDMLNTDRNTDGELDYDTSGSITITYTLTDN